MFGKLSWDAIPFNQPIPMAASLGVILAIAAIIVLVLGRAGRRYLWDEWITSVDHKRHRRDVHRCSPSSCCSAASSMR